MAPGPVGQQLQDAQLEEGGILMDMTNLKSQNGFATRDDILLRMARFRLQGNGDFYRLQRLKHGSFSQVGAMAYGTTMRPLFKIYTGNKAVYDYISELVTEAAKALASPVTVDGWREDAE
jgi:hypothetical protein